MSVVGAAFSLFVVYNVLGNISLYIAILKPFSQKRQRIILFREMCIALGILLIFGFFGKSVLNFLGITSEIIGIAGGIILFLISLDMLFPRKEEEAAIECEPLVVPLAVPMMSGPGSIAATMIYAEQLHIPWKIASFITLAWLPSLGIVLLAPLIRYFVGDKGLLAFVRFGGFLLCLISVQMTSSGIITLIKTHF